MFGKLPISTAGIAIIVGLFVFALWNNAISNTEKNFNTISVEYNHTQTSFPGAVFFNNLGNYYFWMKKLQTHLDQAAKTRQGVIGNIAWFPSQLYYYARSVSQDSISNVCEIGYGAGHSTILYLTINPRAHVYSFDIFPNTTDGRVHTANEISSLQQAFQAVTLDAIANNETLASRFHKITGDSNITVPEFIKRNFDFRCDFLSIDGSHIPPQPFFDILNSQSLAHKDTVVILDDMDSKSMKDELDKAVRFGILNEYECLKPELYVDWQFSSMQTYFKEFCVARYKNVTGKRV